MNNILRAPTATTAAAGLVQRATTAAAAAAITKTTTTTSGSPISSIRQSRRVTPPRLATTAARRQARLFSAAAAASTTTASYEQAQRDLSYPIIPASDFGAFKEYSVIHTDRSLNLMSDPFQQVMRDLNLLLKTTYNADKAVIIPGSGTYGMEAVARQFATNQHCLVIRNGWFSYRWTEIFDLGHIPASHTVLMAQPVPIADQDDNNDNDSAAAAAGAASSSDGALTHFAPHAVDQVVERIHEERPAVVFAPHVETSTGMMLSDDYIRQVAAATHDVGGLFVLDCIASGTVWLDMKDLGIDVLISAPQKGWSGPPCAALVMMAGEAVQAKLQESAETSFSVSLKRWSAIMDTYEAGGFGYHTTMPTDALRDFHEISVETLQVGLPQLKQAQLQMGHQARDILNSKGLVSVAAPGAQAPGVLVYYSPQQTDNPVMMQQFKRTGLQIAMGVPWKIDEPDGLKTFRIGLFGLDKLCHIPETLATMEQALDTVLAGMGHGVPPPITKTAA